jgi:DNA-directed RNA polymerase specialized sigma subunit
MLVCVAYQDIRTCLGARLEEVEDPFDRIREALVIPRQLYAVTEMVIGETVRELRRTHSLREIALELGVTKQRVSQMSQMGMSGQADR